VHIGTEIIIQIKLYMHSLTLDKEQLPQSVRITRRFVLCKCFYYFSLHIFL